MMSLVIDAASDKIFFSIIKENQSYTNSHLNSRENFDKIVILLNNFLINQKVEMKDIKKIYVNKGPGKFSSVRTSLSIAKAIALANEIILVGFSSDDLKNEKDYKYLIELDKKDKLTKGLIKPLYSS